MTRSFNYSVPGGSTGPTLTWRQAPESVDYIVGRFEVDGVSCTTGASDPGDYFRPVLDYSPGEPDVESYLGAVDYSGDSHPINSALPTAWPFELPVVAGSGSGPTAASHTLYFEFYNPCSGNMTGTVDVAITESK
jgi:hypothetical protein